MPAAADRAIARRFQLYEGVPSAAMNERDAPKTDPAIGEDEMATPVQMKHKVSGILKKGYYGFSWTSLFFGGFPALFRGDVAYGLGVLAAGVVFGAFSAGFLWFVIGLVWAFIYNKNYTHRLLQAGYEFTDTPERVAEAKRALGVAL